MPQTVRVTVQGGKAIVSTQGFTGQACYDATKQLKEKLGKVESDEPTPEFFDQVGRTIGQS